MNHYSYGFWKETEEKLDGKPSLIPNSKFKSLSPKKGRHPFLHFSIHPQRRKENERSGWISCPCKGNVSQSKCYKDR